MSAVALQPIKLVLDTNIVLDWLVFADPSIQAIATAISARQIEVVTHQLAIDELQRVLNYPQLKLDPLRQASVLARYRAASSMPSMPENFSSTNLLLPLGFPECRDADDQLFLALSYHAHCNALVSRDKELLRLQSRAKKFAVNIFNVPQVLAAFDIVQRQAAVC